MNSRTLSYWIPTALFSLALTGSGLAAATHQAPMVAVFTHLGYPMYFMTLLGVAKLLGVATVLAPGLPRLKEWAYAGFTINLLSAAISHLASGDPAGNAVPPLVLLGLALASWHFRPASRTLQAPAAADRVERPALATA
jgi:uncharacterized membrane protein YphA (DoxX/SURF4 family)